MNSSSRSGSTAFSSTSSARAAIPKLRLEEFDDVFPRRFLRRSGFEFLKHWEFNHGLASSHDLEQPRVTVPQAGQKLGHGEQVFLLARRRVAIDAGAALVQDRLPGGPSN